jgi:hypothetical protein
MQTRAIIALLAAAVVVVTPMIAMISCVSAMPAAPTSKSFRLPIVSTRERPGIVETNATTLIMIVVTKAS